MLSASLWLLQTLGATMSCAAQPRTGTFASCLLRSTGNVLLGSEGRCL